MESGYVADTELCTLQNKSLIYWPTWSARYCTTSTSDHATNSVDLYESFSINSMLPEVVMHCILFDFDRSTYVELKTPKHRTYTNFFLIYLCLWMYLLEHFSVLSDVYTALRCPASTPRLESRPHLLTGRVFFFPAYLFATKKRKCIVWHTACQK